METQELPEVQAHRMLKDPTLLLSTGMIDGKPREAVDKRRFSVFEPSTGSVLIRCADLGKQDFLDAISSAEHGTKRFYERTTARERGAMLFKWHHLILDNADDCTPLVPLTLRRT